MIPAILSTAIRLFVACVVASAVLLAWNLASVGERLMWHAATRGLSNGEASTLIGAYPIDAVYRRAMRRRGFAWLFERPFAFPIVLLVTWPAWLPGFERRLLKAIDRGADRRWRAR